MINKALQVLEGEMLKKKLACHDCFHYFSLKNMEKRNSKRCKIQIAFKICSPFCIFTLVLESMSPRSNSVKLLIFNLWKFKY